MYSWGYWRFQTGKRTVIKVMLAIVLLIIVALYHLRYITLSTVLLIVIIINRILMYVWEQ